MAKPKRPKGKHFQTTIFSYLDHDGEVLAGHRPGCPTLLWEPAHGVLAFEASETSTERWMRLSASSCAPGGVLLTCSCCEQAAGAGGYWRFQADEPAHLDPYTGKTRTPHASPHVVLCRACVRVQAATGADIDRITLPPSAVPPLLRTGEPRVYAQAVVTEVRPYPPAVLAEKLAAVARVRAATDFRTTKEQTGAKVYGCGDPQSRGTGSSARGDGAVRPGGRGGDGRDAPHGLPLPALGA